MHPRTRHASLDFPRSTDRRLSPQEEWCEFLSTSMAALTTEDEDDAHDVGSRSLSSLNGLEIRRTGKLFEPLKPTTREDPSAVGNGKGKRRDSFSESLTSSTGSSPGGAAWRPLGRRASAHVISSSNQLDHLEYGFDLPPLGHTNGAKKLAHSASFRDMRISSSGSSLVESSSSDEEANDPLRNKNRLERGAHRPAMLNMDRSYPGSPQPTLSQESRNVTMEPHASQLLHVKSPVLSSRKDAQTWQMHNEELLTSPRFGQFRSSLDETTASVFGNGLGLFAEESNNQVIDSVETRTRAPKDARASSVDFTHVRPAELNPPLPPTQEPQYQRMRARSFSYSAGFGNNNNYNSTYANKQYMPQHPPQAEFPVTMRQFHSGPPPPQPASLMQQGPLRPPRVSIPASDAHQYHHHHQAAPPPSYRRYSTEFTGPQYNEGIPPHEPEVQLQRTSSGRGIRSYSMEYFQTNQRVRTHSLEGNQMFAPAAPLAEYPVSGRHSGGGVSYEWPRSPMGAPPAPPLPPDVRVGNNAMQYPPPPPEAYYEVEFKRGRTEVFAGKAGYNPGEYVKVEADRGEDIGRVGRRIMDISKINGSSSPDPANQMEDSLGRPKRHELPSKKIISVANARELELLDEQRKEEHEVFEVCKSKVRQRLLPMNVIDAEYQYDRHKLTFFFEADRRIDFRELVRDLFAIYKTRIWLQQVVPNGKKPMNEMEAI